MSNADWTVEQKGVSILSDKGYRITSVRMAVGYWYTAFSPGGCVIASGHLARCKQACDDHAARENRRNKRPYRIRLQRRVSYPAILKSVTPRPAKSTLSLGVERALP